MNQSLLRELNQMQRRFDRLWDDVFTPLSTPFATIPARSAFEYNPPCDIDESDSHYIVSLDVPGMSKEDLHVEVQGDQLILSGSRREEHVSRRAEPTVAERYQGKFYRSMTIPGLSEESKIEAVYKDGVLRVAVPKELSAQKKVIPISEEKTGFWSKLLGKAEERREEKAA
jgi:HSP20 family protein